MFTARIETANFTNKIRQYASLVKKSMSEVVLEQGRLLAERLTKLTYPVSAKQGKKRVSIDIGRVYLKPKWFTEVFSFQNAKYGLRLKNAVRSQDTGALTDIFQNSSRLNLIRLEPFDSARHEKLRRNGRILVPNPRSFPVTNQSKLNAYTKEKQKNVGLAKAGWAVCASALGKSQPSWLSSKSTAGKVENHTADTDKPYLILTNSVSYFSALNAKADIISRALEGRGRDMIKSAEYALRKAAKDANLSS